MRQIPYSLETVVFGILGSGRLCWLEPLLSEMTCGWQDLGRELQPLKIRWRKVLLLAALVFLAMGEWAPSASTIAVAP